MRSCWLNQWYWGYLILLGANGQIVLTGPAVRYQVKLVELGRFKYIPDKPYHWKFTKNSKGSVALADMDHMPFVRLTYFRNWFSGQTVTFSTKELEPA